MRAADAIEAGAVSRTAGVEAKACTVVFPSGARLTVIATGLEDGYVADVAAELSRFLLSSPPPPPVIVRGGIELDAADLGDLVHTAQPEAGEGGGK